MPKIINIEENILFELNLLNNEYLDIDFLRDDFENWIPFDFSLCIEKEKYNYAPEDGATFTLYELKNMITGLGDIIGVKRDGLKTENFLFHSSEGYFDFKIYDPLEEDLLSIEIWINIGILTQGKSSGYNKGFQFDIQLSSFKTFAEQLSEHLKQIISLYESIRC